MESKGKKYNYKISGIIAIAVVSSIVGTLALTDFETNSDSNTQTQSIGIGAYVTVRAYHEDGTLFQNFEEHNELTDMTINALVACITGLDTTPSRWDTCVFGVHRIQLGLFDGFTATSVVQDAIVSPTPENCDFDTEVESDLCTGWTMETTFDFADLSCTENVDCPEAFVLSANTVNIPANFNTIDIDPSIPIVPNDRLVITMDFTIPS